MNETGGSRDRRRVGKAYEDLAATYLESQGYAILARNYHARRGELDLIALEGETLVFVEVRMRKSADPVSPMETITAQKRRRMALAARTYLARHRITDRDCRFDVVGILHPPGCAPKFDHLRNAFLLEPD